MELSGLAPPSGNPTGGSKALFALLRRSGQATAGGGCSGAAAIGGTGVALSAPGSGVMGRRKRLLHPSFEQQPQRRQRLEEHRPHGGSRLASSELDEELRLEVAPAAAPSASAAADRSAPIIGRGRRDGKGSDWAMATSSDDEEEDRSLSQIRWLKPLGGAAQPSGGGIAPLTSTAGSVPQEGMTRLLPGQTEADAAALMAGPGLDYQRSSSLHSQSTMLPQPFAFTPMSPMGFGMQPLLFPHPAMAMPPLYGPAQQQVMMMMAMNMMRPSLPPPAAAAATVEGLVLSPRGTMPPLLTPEEWLAFQMASHPLQLQQPQPPPTASNRLQPPAAQPEGQIHQGQLQELREEEDQTSPTLLLQRGGVEQRYSLLASGHRWLREQTEALRGPLTNEQRRRICSDQWVSILSWLDGEKGRLAALLASDYEQEKLDRAEVLKSCSKSEKARLKPGKMNKRQVGGGMWGRLRSEVSAGCRRIVDEFDLHHCVLRILKGRPC